MTRYKKVLSLLICVMLIVSGLCACDKKIYITTGLKDTEIFKISGEACRLSEILMVLMTEKSRYETDLGKGIWSATGADENHTLEDQIKEKVKNEMAELKSIDAFADKQKIALSDDEKKALDGAAKEYFATLTEEAKELLGITVDDVKNLYTSFYKVEKVYDKLTADVQVEISDEEARVIEVNYIFIATCRLDENNNKIQYSENELNAATDKIENVRKLLDVGTDFVTLAEEYSDSDKYNRIFARGQMIEAFEESAFKLQQGQISEAVETEDGYYIIQCVSDYLVNETAMNKADMEDEVKKISYEESYEPFKKEQTFEFNDKIWEDVKLENYSGVNTVSLYDIYNKWMEQ